MRPILFVIPDWLPLIGGMPLYSYGLMLGISFIVGWYLAFHFTEKDNIESRFTTRTLIYVIIGSLIGARILFFISNPDKWHGVGSFLKLRQGGLIAYGGYIGGTVTAVVYCYRKKVNFWRFADHVAPSMALGLGFTRIGCFLYGCDYGKVTDSSLGMIFPKWSEESIGLKLNGSPAYLHHLQHQLINTDAAASLPVYPTQIYSSINGFIAFALLMWAYKKRTFYGQILLVFMAYYAITRFLLEIIRDDLQRGSVWIFSTSQFISIIVLAVTAYLYKRQREDRIPEGDPVPVVVFDKAGKSEEKRHSKRKGRKKKKKK